MLKYQNFDFYYNMSKAAYFMLAIRYHFHDSSVMPTINDICVTILAKLI